MTSHAVNVNRLMPGFSCGSTCHETALRSSDEIRIAPISLSACAAFSPIRLRMFGPLGLRSLLNPLRTTSVLADAVPLTWKYCAAVAYVGAVVGEVMAMTGG